jgi:signal peptidase I
MAKKETALFSVGPAGIQGRAGKATRNRSNPSQGGFLEKEQRKTKKSVVREYAESIIIAILLALLIRAFVVQAFKIPSGSMKPTLQIGDHILVNKFIYGIKLKIPFTAINFTLIPTRSPKRNDVVVFIYPEDPKKDFIKRVIGLPGDRLEVINKKVFINNQPLEDPHGFHTDLKIYSPLEQRRDNVGPIQIPPGHYFVMGDNRDESYDSRFWGFVKEKELIGEAFIIYWSWDRTRFGVRWERLGKLIH